jgi:hypothetical protein
MSALGLLSGAALVLAGAHQLSRPAAYLGSGLVPATDPRTVQRFGGFLMALGALIFVLNLIRLAQG